MLNLDEIIAEFNEATAWPQEDERWFRAIAEEAGEVVGAYNKWTDRKVSKPKTRGDVFEEMTQLMGCIFAAASRLGYSSDDLLKATEEFMAAKAAWLRADDC